MTEYEVEIGQPVRASQGFMNVPEGTEGVIIEDYGSGVTVGWNRPGRRYPFHLQPNEVAQLPAVDPKCPLRDGFDKETELKYLEVVDT